ncbi:hypothetical protein F5882DRAFT_420578, partial [Hyaloscypha sp. PMI_1271]
MKLYLTLIAALLGICTAAAVPGSPSGKGFQTRQLGCKLRCATQILINGGGDLNQCMALCKKGHDIAIGSIRRSL